MSKLIVLLHSKVFNDSAELYFTPEEYEKSFEAVVTLEVNSRKEKTRQIRELLIDYMEFAVYTGTERSQKWII